MQLKEARTEGREEGKEEGKEEGRKEGRQRGVMEERKKMASRLLSQEEVDLDLIVTASGLSKEEVLKIQKEMTQEGGNHPT